MKLKYDKDYKTANYKKKKTEKNFKSAFFTFIRICDL